MYSFVDSLNGEALTMRPENTRRGAGAIEHSLLYEDRPPLVHGRCSGTSGRSAAVIGSSSGRSRSARAGRTGCGAEQIVMLGRCGGAGLAGVRLELNTLGQPPERARHRAD